MENELRDAAARELVEHLRDHSAASITLPVVVEDEAYEVIVRHKPVECTTNLNQSVCHACDGTGLVPN